MPLGVPILALPVRRLWLVVVPLCRQPSVDGPLLALAVVPLVAVRLCWRVLASCLVPVVMLLFLAVAVHRHVADVCSLLPVMESRAATSSFAVVAAFRQRAVT